MGLKEAIKKGFDDEKTKFLYRYKASRVVFLFICLLFFISFFLAGAGFYRTFFIYAFSFLYILILFTGNIFLYMFFESTFYGKVNGIYKVLLFIFLFIVTVGLMFPVIYEGGIIGFSSDYLDFSNFDINEIFNNTIDDIKNMLP